MDRAGTTVAVVREVVGAFVVRGGRKTCLFATTGGLKFVIAAHG